MLFLSQEAAFSQIKTEIQSKKAKTPDLYQDKSGVYSAKERLNGV